MQEFWNYLCQLATTVGLKILYALIILVVGLKLVSMLARFINRGKGFNKLDRSLQTFLSGAIRIVLNIVVVLTAAIVLGIPTTSFVTILASAGVAVGLALQGSLSNFAGGLMLMFFKPFKVGDYIEAGGNSGTVEAISPFYTVIITNEQKHITLPNGTLSNNAIINYTSVPYRRVDLTVSVAYGTDLETVKGLLMDTARAHALVLKDPEPFARLDATAASSLDFALRVYCKPENYWTVLFDIREAVVKKLVDNNIEIPFQQIDIHTKAI